MNQDYSLLGPTGRAAETSGFANPKWYRTDVDPKVIRGLMEKSDKRALLDTLLWFAILISTAWLAIALWPSWWSMPVWAVYGVFYGSASDSRWHECGHKTAFKTQWMNTVVYHIACFMLIRNPYTWRASHVRHHTDTIIVGRDPEIVAMRPPDLAKLLINLTGIIDVYHLTRRMFLHASGRIDPEEATYTRDVDHPKVTRVARIWLAIYAMVIGLAIAMGTILPLMVIGLPRLYGAWHHVMTGALQHLGLAENVTDHRLNTRTVLMNPISRFIYLNMNYHLEHHMFTMVPYYNLPKLHELIKHDTPSPNPSIFAAFKQIAPVLVRQLRYHDAVIVPDLPSSAVPFGPQSDLLRKLMQ